MSAKKKGKGGGGGASKGPPSSSAAGTRTNTKEVGRGQLLMLHSPVCGIHSSSKALGKPTQVTAHPRYTPPPPPLPQHTPHT
jgi:hypothetical protein